MGQVFQSLRPTGTIKAQAFATELATYHEYRRFLADRHPGEFVLIKGTRLRGVFPTRDAALSYGLNEFGLESFLVKHIVPFDQVLRVTRPPLSGSSQPA